MIYLDHAATTPVAKAVLEAMLPYFSEKYGNAESLHTLGRESKIALDQARKTIAEILDCRSSEIIFTASGTEANNLAILGSAKRAHHKHLITSKIEHPSVLEPCKQLEKQGWKITWLNIDHQGFIDLKELEQALQQPTALVSIIYANNEIGSIQDIEKISQICKQHKTPLHIDACQAPNYLPLNFKNVDMITLNSSKIYGPKGCGALYVKQDTPLSPITFGGNQENKFRPGTHNIPNIVGFAKALEIAQQERNKENERMTKITEAFIATILAEISDSKLNSPTTSRLPNIINIALPGTNSQEMLLKLDEEKIYVSTGSACKAGSTEPSHVLQALKLSKPEIIGSIRISCGRQTTSKDLETTAKKIIEICSKMRLNRFQKV